MSLVEQGELTFWNTSRLAKCYGKNIALIENEVENVRTVSYQELEHLVIEAKQKLSSYHSELNNKLLIMLVANNSIESVVYYLAALQLGQSIWWVEKDSEKERLHSLQTHYGVNLLINNEKIQVLDSTPVALHDDLALLITTSGSTGSPTLVKLSYQNIHSNCVAIGKALTLTSSDMTVTTLPLQYSFGLSILNTHLNAGSTIILTDASLMSRDFWSLFKTHPIKCLYGVPYTFEMLLKLSLPRLPFNSLRFMAVAGGKLSADKVTLVNDYCLSKNSEFYVMYGQTEASARMTVLAPEKAKTKPMSIGQPIAGKLWLEDEQGNVIEQADSKGELCYQGDNVMMGIAQEKANLLLPAHTSVLKTGDLGIVDNEGDYQIVGRLKRMIKVLGHRINLDEIERFFSDKKQSVICTGEDDMIFCYLINNSQNKQQLRECQQLLNNHLSVHSNYSQWTIIDEIPYLSSGKINYPQLEQLRFDSDVSNKEQK